MNQQTIQAVVDCLIPPDDFPGATAAGVCDYLTALFKTDLAPQLEFFLAGLDAIDAESRARFQANFHALTTDQQISTLQTIESGDVTSSWPVSPQSFFELLVNTTAEGFYSDPNQGGNRGSISWIMVGFEDPIQK